jgi:hypothetical protein
VGARTVLVVCVEVPRTAVLLVYHKAGWRLCNPGLNPDLNIYNFVFFFFFFFAISAIKSILFKKELSI